MFTWLTKTQYELDDRTKRPYVGLHEYRLIGMYQEQSSKQNNSKYQTSPAVCNRTLNSIYFLNLSAIRPNAKITIRKEMFPTVLSALHFS